MIDYDLFCKIKNLNEQYGLTPSQIAGELAIDPRTVSKWLHEERFRQRSSSPRESKLDPFKNDILRMVTAHPYSAAQVLARIRENGFNGGYTIVKDYVRRIRSRPRAAFLTLAVARNRGAVLLLMPFLAALPAYVPFEMKEDIMLGDSGAYLLGGALGFTFAVYAPFPAQLAALALLLAFQAFCERHSFSRLVRCSNILRFLDELGRVFREEEEDEQEP